MKTNELKDILAKLELTSFDEARMARVIAHSEDQGERAQASAALGASRVAKALADLFFSRGRFNQVRGAQGLRALRELVASITSRETLASAK